MKRKPISNIGAKYKAAKEKKSKKEILEHYKKELQVFMNKYEIETINFGNHKLKRKKGDNNGKE